VNVDANEDDSQSDGVDNVSQNVIRFSIFMLFRSSESFSMDDSCSRFDELLIALFVVD
jgi:hypothetical protein